MTTSPLPNDLATIIARTEALSQPYAVRLAGRFSYLVEAFAEDYDGALPSWQSLNSMVDYLVQNSAIPCPEVTLTPTGDWVGEWLGPQRRKLAIEFLASGAARILVSWPNLRHPERIDRLVMTTTIDALVDTIKPLAPYTELAA